ncbi:hypothetical protein C8R48DRAFT_381349 [Suillus tomentosus]|nr:hypothetical protein C8R48DRAFT_381349 [Suillus tomentosus]
MEVVVGVVLVVEGVVEVCPLLVVVAGVDDVGVVVGVDDDTGVDWDVDVGVVDVDVGVVVVATDDQLVMFVHLLGYERGEEILGVVGVGVVIGGVVVGDTVVAAGDVVATGADDMMAKRNKSDFGVGACFRRETIKVSYGKTFAQELRSQHEEQGF